MRTKIKKQKTRTIIHFTWQDDTPHHIGEDKMTRANNFFN